MSAPTSTPATAPATVVAAVIPITFFHSGHMISSMGEPCHSMALTEARQDTRFLFFYTAGGRSPSLCERSRGPSLAARIPHPCVHAGPNLRPQPERCLARLPEPGIQRWVIGYSLIGSRAPDPRVPWRPCRSLFTDHRSACPRRRHPIAETPLRRGERPRNSA